MTKRMIGVAGTHARALTCGARERGAAQGPACTDATACRNASAFRHTALPAPSLPANMGGGSRGGGSAGAGDSSVSASTSWR